MIYIRGDTHGDLSYFSDKWLPGQSGWTSNDKLIITGDFGFVFRNSLAEKNNLDALAQQKSFEIMFIPGNHENHPALQAYPEVKRYGNMVRKIRENIYMLQTGNIYIIEGHTFFTFGGGYSIDKPWRIEYERIFGEKIWFEEEMPTPEEYQRAINSLKDADMKVDYVLTHTAPGSVIPDVINKYPDPHERELNDFLDDIFRRVNWGEWFFGHFHKDMRVNERMIACFEKLHCIGNNV